MPLTETGGIAGFQANIIDNDMSNTGKSFKKKGKKGKKKKKAVGDNVSAAGDDDFEWKFNHLLEYITKLIYRCKRKYQFIMYLI